MLGAQYVFRYRKYQLAESVGEPDSPAHTPRTSMDGSIPLGQVPSRAVSTSTLLSEVVSFVKIRPRGRWMKKHSRLRESVDAEALENVLQAKKEQRYIIMTKKNREKKLFKSNNFLLHFFFISPLFVFNFLSPTERETKTKNKL